MRHTSAAEHVPLSAAAPPLRSQSNSVVSTGEDAVDFADAETWTEDSPPFPRSAAFVHPQYPLKIPLSTSNRAVAEKNFVQFKNTFSDPDPATFLVRGPRYLDEGRGGTNLKHLKQPGVEPPFAIEALSEIRAPKRLYHVSQEVQQLRRMFASHPPDQDRNGLPRFLVCNWILSNYGGTNACVIGWFFLA